MFQSLMKQINVICRIQRLCCKADLTKSAGAFVKRAQESIKC